ncbi:MAG: HD domain-containing protein [Lachnospiraceae bacterium]|nr:HD domain-containing protein [Lachnospiraceae bacterium]
MINNENLLLKNALIYENGHKRRTQHILKVYALSSCIATSENLTEEQLTVIKAATILHDIAIKSCKEKYGNAEQSLQQKEALNIVPTMLKAANYLSSLTDDILFLILNHHNYNNISDIRLQILVEADLLVNYMEDPDEYAALHICDTDLFKTKTGFELKMKIMGK